MENSPQNFLRNTRLRFLDMLEKGDFDPSCGETFAAILVGATDCCALESLKLCELIGVPNSTFYRWRNGQFNISRYDPKRAIRIIKAHLRCILQS